MHPHDIAVLNQLQAESHSSPDEEDEWTQVQGEQSDSDDNYNILAFPGSAQEDEPGLTSAEPSPDPDIPSNYAPNDKASSQQGPLMHVGLAMDLPEGAGVVPIPMIHWNLDEACQVILPVHEAPRSSLSVIQSTPVSCPDDSASQARSWSGENREHKVIACRDFGIPFSGQDSKARDKGSLAVDASWGITDAPQDRQMRIIGRMPGSATGWALTPESEDVNDVALLVPEACRDGFIKKAKALFPSGRIPGYIVNSFEVCRIEAHKLGRSPEAFAKTGLADAVLHDAKALGLKQRVNCGNLTRESRTIYEDGAEIRRLTSMPCNNHRCECCAPRIAALWKARVWAQIQRDMANGSASYIHLVLTCDRAKYTNSVEATRALLDGKKGPWRKLTERLRRIDPDLGFFRVLEFHRDGYPHLHVLVRSKVLVHAALEESGFGTVEELLTKARDINADNRRRKQERRTGRRPSAFPALKARIQKAARASGFGHSKVILVTDPEGMPSELCKVLQLHPTFSRGARRFQTSGRSGNGKESSFFWNETRTPSCEAPIPPEEQRCSYPDDEHGFVHTVDVTNPHDLPAIKPGSDIRLGPGFLNVRVDDVVEAKGRFHLLLRVLGPERLTQTTLRHSVRPETKWPHVRALLEGLGISLHPSLTNLSTELLLGQTGWVDFKPRFSPDPVTDQPIPYDRFDWFPAWAGVPEGMMSKPALPTVLGFDPQLFDLDTKPIDKQWGSLVAVAIHLAPVEAVAMEYAQDKAEIRFRDPWISLRAQEEGILVRHIQSCIEANRPRSSEIEAIDNYIEWINALESFGPQDVKSINDFPALRSNLEDYRSWLLALADVG